MESSDNQVDHNQDVSQERYTGYASQTRYQKDLKMYVNEEICGALTRDKKFCRQKPLENGRCKLHGGHSPNGLDHPRTKHGSYSKYIPKELMSKYRDSQDNEELLSLRDETALITTRIMQLVEDVEERSGALKTRDMIRTYRNWQSAKRKGLDSADMLQVDFEDAIEDIEKDMKVWDDIGNMVNLKRRLVDSEQKKMNNMAQYIPVEKVMLLIGALMDIVVKEVERREGVLLNAKEVEELNTTIARKFRAVTNQSEDI